MVTVTVVGGGATSWAISVMTMSASSDVAEPGGTVGALGQPKKEAKGPNSLHHNMVAERGEILMWLAVQTRKSRDRWRGK